MGSKSPVCVGVGTIGVVVIAPCNSQQNSVPTSVREVRTMCTALPACIEHLTLIYQLYCLLGEEHPLLRENLAESW